MSGFWDYYRQKTIMITGAGGHLGQALARELAKKTNCRFLLLGREFARLRDTEKKLRSLGATDVHNYTVDLTQKMSFNKLRNITRQHPHIDLLLHCAGTIVSGPVTEANFTEFERVTQTNYLGTVMVNTVLAEYFSAKKAGHIVNIASVSALAGFPEFSAFNGSKFAVLGFSEALALELEPAGVAVSVVCPSAFESPGTRELEPQPFLLKKYPRVDTGKIVHRALKDISRQRRLILPDTQSRLLYYVRRWAPGLLRRWIRLPR